MTQASTTTTQSQLDNFKEAARHLKTDDAAECFKGRVEKLLKYKPE